jgi:hypothetical protein
MGSRFLIKQEWSGGSSRERQIKRVSLNFLPVVGELTGHHEPPSFQTRPKVIIELDHAGHAAFHYYRYEMYGFKQDLDAYMAQTSLMNDREAVIDERIHNSPRIIELIRREIIKRH